MLLLPPLVSKVPELAWHALVLAYKVGALRPGYKAVKVMLRLCGADHS